MLTELFPFLDVRHIQADLPAKLRRLAADLEFLQQSDVAEIALRQAPLIDQWVAVVTPVGLRLMGAVSGHPRLGDRQVMTSPLWAAASDGSWVRTTSRFYRLGEPADETVRELIGSVIASFRDGETSSEGQS
jgi:hypothetical protein